MSEGVSVQSTPCLPSLWHVASFSHARRFSQTWPATGLDPPSDPLAASSAQLVRRGCARVHLDDEGQDQGNSVGLVQSFTPGAGYMVNLLWIPRHVTQGLAPERSCHGNPGRYDLARSNSLDLTVTRGEPPVQPIGTWRRLGTYVDYSLADVHWVCKQKVRAVGRGSTMASTTGAATFLMIILPLYLLHASAPPTPPFLRSSLWVLPRLLLFPSPNSVVHSPLRLLSCGMRSTSVRCWKAGTGCCAVRCRSEHSQSVRAVVMHAPEKCTGRVRPCRGDGSGMLGAVPLEKMRGPRRPRKSKVNAVAGFTAASLSVFLFFIWASSFRSSLWTTAS